MLLETWMENNNQGWINLYKPTGISSFLSIYKIKKKFNIKKIGHAGTLDPNAEGILPIAINKTTKLIPFINSNIKSFFSRNIEYALLPFIFLADALGGI